MGFGQATPWGISEKDSFEIIEAFGNAGGNFIDGLSRTLGMDTSIISIIILVLGLVLLWSAIRAFMNAAFIMGIIWLMLGLWLLSWIMH